MTRWWSVVESIIGSPSPNPKVTNPPRKPEVVQAFELEPGTPSDSTKVEPPAASGNKHAKFSGTQPAMKIADPPKPETAEGNGVHDDESVDSGKSECESPSPTKETSLVALAPPTSTTENQFSFSSKIVSDFLVPKFLRAGEKHLALFSFLDSSRRAAIGKTLPNAHATASGFETNHDPDPDPNPDPPPPSDQATETSAPPCSFRTPLPLFTPETEVTENDETTTTETSCPVVFVQDSVLVSLVFLQVSFDPIPTLVSIKRPPKNWSKKSPP